MVRSACIYLFHNMVCIYLFHNMVTLPLWLAYTDFRTCLYRCSLSNFTLVSWHMLKCSCTRTVSCPFMYCCFASIGHADMIWFMVSWNCWHNLHLLSVSVCNIFVAWYFVCDSGSCAATVSPIIIITTTTTTYCVAVSSYTPSPECQIT
jgi:hypothetical protein